MAIPRLVIAGTHSGVGKTTISVGLMAALRRRGLVVQPFKVGPDYIDPSHHTIATGRVSRNLDSWMVPRPALLELFDRACQGADLAVVEGVMGLFDGHGGRDETGSTAEIAKLLDAPVLVVIDASRMARSAAALAWGYARFDPSLEVAGFLANRIGGEKHYQIVREAIESSGAGRLFGYMPKNSALHLAERHLGLVPTEEQSQPGGFLDTLVELIESHLDLDGLLEAASKGAVGSAPHPSPFTLHPSLFPPAPVPKQAIVAVARDEAFNFYYQDNLDLLEAHGAELICFSPLRDAGIPPEAGALYLGGGFPEEHAAALAANRPMIEAIRRAVAGGMPVYGECGGLMYLSEGIVDSAGEIHPMVGVVPGRCTMVERRLKLGYVEVRALRGTPLGAAGYLARGHEFHYSTWEGCDASDSAYQVLNQASRGEGFARGNLLASFAHLHFGTNPALAPAFVRAAAGHKKREGQQGARTR